MTALSGKSFNGLLPILTRLDSHSDAVNLIKALCVKTTHSQCEYLHSVYFDPYEYVIGLFSRYKNTPSPHDFVIKRRLSPSYDLSYYTPDVHSTVIEILKLLSDYPIELHDNDPHNTFTASLTSTIRRLTESLYKDDFLLHRIVAGKRRIVTSYLIPNAIYIIYMYSPRINDKFLPVNRQFMDRMQVSNFPKFDMYMASNVQLSYRPPIRFITRNKLIEHCILYLMVDVFPDVLSGVFYKMDREYLKMSLTEYMNELEMVISLYKEDPQWFKSDRPPRFLSPHVLLLYYQEISKKNNKKKITKKKVS